MTSSCLDQNQLFIIFSFFVQLKYIFFSSFETAPSGPPVNVQGHATTSRSLVLEWDPPLLRDRNGIISDYRVNLLALEEDPPNPVGYIVTGDSIGLTALHPHYNYSCTVSASTGVGQGPLSTPLFIKTYPDGKSMDLT